MKSKERGLVSLIQLNLLACVVSFVCIPRFLFFIVALLLVPMKVLQKQNKRFETRSSFFVLSVVTLKLFSELSSRQAFVGRKLVVG